MIPFINHILASFLYSYIVIEKLPGNYDPWVFNVYQGQMSKWLIKFSQGAKIALNDLLSLRKEIFGNFGQSYKSVININTLKPLMDISDTSNQNYWCATFKMACKLKPNYKANFQ